MGLSRDELVDQATRDLKHLRQGQGVGNPSAMLDISAVVRAGMAETASASDRGEAEVVRLMNGHGRGERGRHCGTARDSEQREIGQANCAAHIDADCIARSSSCHPTCAKWPKQSSIWIRGTPIRTSAGIAPGVDRIVMLLADEPNIRETIAFPLNQNAQDLLMGAPNEIGEDRLKELHVDVRKPSAKG